MKRDVRKYNSAVRTTSKRKLEVDWFRLILIFLLVSLVGYGVYAFFSFRSIKTKDPLKEQGSHFYLLSQNKNTFQKTLLVFENENAGESRIEQVYVYARNTEKEESVLVYVPSWLYYGGLENDFGNAIPVSSFRYAGDFLQQGRGVEYAVWQLEQLLGMNFDNYVWFTPNAIKSIEQNIGEINGDLLYAPYYENGSDISQESLFLNSFLSRLDWFKLITSASKFKDANATIYSSNSSLMGVFIDMKKIEDSIYATKPYLLDLSTSRDIVQEESSNAGGLVNYLNTMGFDSTWRNVTSKLLDVKLEQESVRVEVYNGSGISGAAAQFARKIENAGCEVVRYDNAPEVIGKTTFYVPKPELFPESLSIISELFPGQFDQIQGRPLFMTTGDIVVVLGKDISNMYSF